MLLLSLLLLFIFAPIIWLLRPHRSTKAGWLAALPPLAITIWLITQLGAVQHGHEIIESYVWADALNLVLRLRLDGLALFFGIIISGIGAGVALYTAYYLEGDSRQGYFYALLYAFMACMLGVVWSDNLMTLFVFWEGTSITSYLMVGYDHKSKVAQDGARRALIVTCLAHLPNQRNFPSNFGYLAQCRPPHPPAHIYTRPPWSKQASICWLDYTLPLATARSGFGHS